MMKVLDYHDLAYFDGLLKQLNEEIDYEVANRVWFLFINKTISFNEMFIKLQTTFKEKHNSIINFKNN